MSFVKSTLLLFLVFFLASPALSGQEDENYFNVVGPLLEKSQSATIAELKRRAVINWLKSRIGSELGSLESEITAQFADDYVSDFQPGKPVGSKSELQLTGHVDGEGLMRWVRLRQTKSHGGSTIRPAVVISAELPGLTLSAKETAKRTRDTTIARTLYELSVSTLQQFNVALLLPPDDRLPVSTPPRRDIDIRSLRDFGASSNYNGLLWLHLEHCPSCGGASLQLRFYNLAQARTSIENSHNINLAQSQYSNPTVLKAAFGKAFDRFKSSFEEIVSSGTLYSRVYELMVDELSSYRGFRELFKQLKKPDFVTRVSLKRLEQARAYYEVLSPLGPEEFAKQLSQNIFGTFRLQPVRVTSSAIIVRYLGQ